MREFAAIPAAERRRIRRAAFVASLPVPDPAEQAQRRARWAALR